MGFSQSINKPLKRKPKYSRLQKNLAGLQIAGRWVDVCDPEVLASLQA